MKLNADLLNNVREQVKVVNQPGTNEMLANYTYKPVCKKPTPYSFFDGTEISKMPAFSYAVVKTQQKINTVTSDGLETTNVADPGDIIMSGPSNEQYVVKPAKFAKLFTGTIGKDVIPEQSPRMVAKYVEPIPATFKATWGEEMVVKPGDYVVKEGTEGFYRIAKKEFEQTYDSSSLSAKPSNGPVNGVTPMRPENRLGNITAPQSQPVCMSID